MDAKKGLELTRLNKENKMLLERAIQEKIALEKKVLERTEDLHKLFRQLRATYLSIIKSLAKAIDARDHYTHSHSEKVTRYALIIAKELGLSAKEINEIKEACELHDLGKIGIHDCILSKPDKLTRKEWREVQSHSIKGARILKPLTFLGGVIDLIRQHHERYDGAGYPDGLKKEDIELGARIMTVADSFDAMISERPYRKKPFTKKEAIAEIKRNSGAQFDPRVVKAFLKIIDKL